MECLDQLKFTFHPELISWSIINASIDTTQKPRPTLRLSDYHYDLLDTFMKAIHRNYTQSLDNHNTTCQTA